MLRRLPAWAFQRMMNWWPPFRGAGIRVRSIAPDWSAASVELRLGRLNRNAVGSHFGGSLYTMTDPFYALMLLHRLGPGYHVWDHSAAIEYLKPGRGTVTAHFELGDAELERVRAAAGTGAKVLPDYVVEVHDRAGDVVARVHKRLYVRRAAAASA